MTQNPYETETFVADYLLFHYGEPKDLFPYDLIPGELLKFHQRIREECVLPICAAGVTSALDIGCGVGRFTFELAQVADRALGLDSSKAFIQAAQLMARIHCQAIPVKESGKEFRPIVLTLPDVFLKSNVEFQVGDALDLSAFPDQSFHIVAAINLICRLPRPRQFLSQLHRLVALEGQLILSSPFTWMEEFTPQDQWLTSKDLEAILQPHFRLITRRNLPFMIREHRRKFQLVMSEVSTFARQSE